MTGFLIILFLTVTVFETCAIGSLQNKLKQAKQGTERDALTGTYSREGFLFGAEKILQGSSYTSEYAVLFFNIKGFKVINELFGVAGGDEVLCETAQLLQNSGLKPLAVGRMSADHFVCLVQTENLSFHEITKLCRRCYLQDKKEFHFYGRCGVYLVNDDSITVSGMCDRAKLAKNYIKDDYAKPYAVFDKTMRDGFVTGKELTSELQCALDQHEFEVYYQPIYDLKTEKLTQAEALVRWNHPEKGLLPPDEFIPVFEENGYISKLDLFVGESSTSFLQDRISSGQYTVPIAVNLSRMDFYNRNLLDVIFFNMKSTRLPEGYPRIEITETAYSALIETNNSALHKMKEQGVKIILDDFGSGYSSFSSIRQFDFDIIKLDMGFIRQIGLNEKAGLIVKDMIELAHHVGAQVVAEGVETKQQAEFLLKEGCDFVQGYLYAKPMPRQEFEQLLDQCQKQGG